MTSGIYAITNIINGHRYIGSAVNVTNRWGHHRPALRQGKHHSSHLQRAWNKYGESAFRFMVLEECEPEELVALEQSWMDNFLPEYNMAPTAGSSLGTRCSEEKRAKLSAANMGHVGWSKGKKHSSEVRARISAAKKGKPNGLLGKKRPSYSATRMGHEVSQETRDKISASHMGKKLSSETRQKMSAAKKGIALSPEHRAKIGAAGREAWANMAPEARGTRAQGIRKAHETWGKTPEAHEVRIHSARIANHAHWHVNRGIINPECNLCKAANP